jgi:hypothetical protein
MKAIINDHIKMLSKEGKSKAVPIWQIRQWIASGIFDLKIKTGNAVGWDFADHTSGLADMQAYEREEQRKQMEKIRSSGMPEAVDQGIAEVMFARKSAVDSAFSSPPIPDVGQDKAAGANAPTKPQDMI